MDALKETLAHLPHTPGIYLYKDTEGKVIYVGKAKDLKKRVSQYFQKGPLPKKTVLLVSQIASIQTKTVPTEFDALLLEAKLIRQYQPKYNMVARDDKSPVYITISKEPLPHIQLQRKPKVRDENHQSFYFGPFQSKKTALGILATIRRSLPFCQQKERTGKPCFYTHIGLCHPCPSEIVHIENPERKEELTKQYQKNIRRIRMILSGKTPSVITDLEKEMRQGASREQFEQAGIIKKQLDALHNLYSTVYDPFTFEDDIMEKTGSPEEIDDLYRILLPYIPAMKKPNRIECVDISGLGDQWSVGSLVSLIDGKPQTDLYKRFRIRTVSGQNDPAMIAEVVRRRMSHREWPFPDLLCVDGGRTQLHAAQKVLAAQSLVIPCIGLAKRNEEIVLKAATGFKHIRLSWTRPGLHLLQRVRDEAHRFAVSYHKKLRHGYFSPA